MIILVAVVAERARGRAESGRRGARGREWGCAGGPGWWPLYGDHADCVEVDGACRPGCANPFFSWVGSSSAGLLASPRGRAGGLKIGA
jgi:hypothetical protein